MSAVSFLISDPSPALQTFLQQVLTGYGFDAAAIKTTGTPQAAAELAPSLKPDFLISDWFAKESLSGIALFRQIASIHPPCRFALLAQGSSPSHEQEAREAGALFLLAKPFSADSARAEIAHALEQLAALHPGIAQAIHAHHPPSGAQARSAKLQLPSLPQYKPGDRVLYRNQVETIQHVILRRGEMVVQLQGMSGLVESTKIQPR